MLRKEFIETCLLILRIETYVACSMPKQLNRIIPSISKTHIFINKRSNSHCKNVFFPLCQIVLDLSLIHLHLDNSSKKKTSIRLSNVYF